MASINLNHINANISSSDSRYITICDNGAVKVGSGATLPENGDDLSEYKGVIRYNEDSNCLQYCDGSVWKNLVYDGQESPTTGKVWSLIF